MTKLNAAIMEAYEGYQTALDYVKGWKQEAASRKAVCMALINAARKSNPELGVIPAKELFSRTAEMYEAAHAPAVPTEDQEAEVEQAPTEDQEAEVEQAPAEDQEAEEQEAEDQRAPADTEEEQAPADDEPEAD